MEHLLTHITGFDMALGFALLLLYIWLGPSTEECGQTLDTNAAD